MEVNKNTDFDEEAFKMKWYKIIFGLKKQFGKKPDMNAILYLIGMNEVGKIKEYAKDEKMDLMHVATCKLLSYQGFYEFEHYDKDGWPHYKLLEKPPYADLSQQEELLKKLVVQYYEENDLLSEL